MLDLKNISLQFDSKLEAIKSYDTGGPNLRRSTRKRFGN
jgi:hypothetical protein